MVYSSVSVYRRQNPYVYIFCVLQNKIYNRGGSLYIEKMAGRVTYSISLPCSYLLWNICFSLCPLYIYCCNARVVYGPMTMTVCVCNDLLVAQYQTERFLFYFFFSFDCGYWQLFFWKIYKYNIYFKHYKNFTNKKKCRVFIVMNYYHLQLEILLSIGIGMKSC